MASLIRSKELVNPAASCSPKGIRLFICQESFDQEKQCSKRENFSEMRRFMIKGETGAGVNPEGLPKE